MTEPPETIELDSPEDLADSRVLDQINYIVAGGDVYQVQIEEYDGDHYLKRVAGIPDSYWERYDDA